LFLSVAINLPAPTNGKFFTRCLSRIKYLKYLKMADPTSRQARLGELSIFLSCLLFSITSVTVKYAGYRFSGSFISFARFTIGGVLAFLLLLAIKKSIRLRDPIALLLRGVLGASAMVTTYIAIQMTGSGHATLLSDTYPVFTAIFGCLFFNTDFRNPLFCVNFTIGSQCFHSAGI
jgi:drug/metabolite transporter (DMT)-like permease